ncbi:hypothetical protein K502DRAFT_363490 [Neoconidiobolus thromboides FSU 785]|nr:hypothetical protein K502DRAFT_363490 [Neoconidiobolus thromboides FSU 785]
MQFNIILLSFYFALSITSKTNNTVVNKVPVTSPVVSNTNPIPLTPSPTLEPSDLATYHQPTGSIQKDDISDSVREETCQNQTNFCDNVCGEIQSFAVVNECNTADFKWRCYCNNGVQPSTKNYTFPAEFVTCTETIRSCQLRCGSNASCSIGCANSKNCTVEDNNNHSKKKSSISNTATSSKIPSIFSNGSLSSPIAILNGLLFVFFLIVG